MKTMKNGLLSTLAAGAFALGATGAAAQENVLQTNGGSFGYASANASFSPLSSRLGLRGGFFSRDGSDTYNVDLGLFEEKINAENSSLESTSFDAGLRALFGLGKYEDGELFFDAAFRPFATWYDDPDGGMLGMSSSLGLTYSDVKALGDNGLTAYGSLIPNFYSRNFENVSEDGIGLNIAGGFMKQTSDYTFNAHALLGLTDASLTGTTLDDVPFETDFSATHFKGSVDALINAWNDETKRFDVGFYTMFDNNWTKSDTAFDLSVLDSTLGSVRSGVKQTYARQRLGASAQFMWNMESAFARFYAQAGYENNDTHPLGPKDGAFVELGGQINF